MLLESFVLYSEQNVLRCSSLTGPALVVALCYGKGERGRNGFDGIESQSEGMPGSELP